VSDQSTGGHADAAVSHADAAHLLRRTAFGGSKEEIDSLIGKSRRECVEIVMGFDGNSSVPEGPDVGDLPWEVDRENEWRVHDLILEWWVDRMAGLSSPSTVPPDPPSEATGLPIYERLAFFWHDHFACGQHKVQDIEAMWDQLRLFRRMALGNFATLLKAVAVHPAMLVALDNQHNTVWNPQENFAREVMELYTCGVGHFSEADVVSMTAAWTGHNTIGFSLGDTHWNSAYVYRDDDHDHGEKPLFGITANWNGIAQHPEERDAIDELVFGSRQHATAERITTLMFRFFANLEPDQTTISELASVFKQSGMEISALVRAILLHDDFWNQSSRWAQVKNPLDFVVSVIRHTGLPASSLYLRHQMMQMGMVPLDPPSVAGWGQGAAWLSTASAWGRGSFASSLRWRAELEQHFSELQHMNADAAVDQIFAFFGIDEPSAETRARLQQWFDEAHESHRWSIATQAPVVGSLVAEFQVY